MLTLLLAAALGPAVPAPRTEIAWTSLSAKMSDGRWAATVTRLSDGRVLVAGGYSFTKKNTVPSADLFDPKTERFSPAAPMTTDRNFATATLLPGGNVLVAGGFSETRGTWDTAEVYDPKTNAWRRTAVPMNDRRELYTATPLRDGTVLLVGGLSLKKRTTLSTAEVYDARKDTFIPTAGPLADDRFGHAAARLSDGRVLIVGGQSWRVGQESRPLASAEIYNPATGIFTATGSLRAARDRPTATTLPDGRVLVIGGTAKGTPPRMAEVYDPATGTFSDAAPLAEGRMGHDACLLPEGRVLVAGGWADARRATTPTAEIYDPRTNSFIAAPPLPFHAHDLALTLLSGGAVLAVSGKSTTGDDKDAISVETAALFRRPTGN